MATATKEKVFNYATEARNELRDQGYREYWSVEKKQGRGSHVVTYFTNGAGKAVLLSECLTPGGERCSWDIYGQLSASNKISDTLEALGDFTRKEHGDSL